MKRVVNVNTGFGSKRASLEALETENGIANKKSQLSGRI